MSVERKAKKWPFADKVRKFISNFEDLEYNDSRVVCKLCNVDLMCWDKRDCRRHVNSKNHRNRKHGSPLSSQVTSDLCLMLIACNVPLHILDKKPFQKFWKKYVPEGNLPSARTVSRYLPKLRKDVICKIKCSLRNKLLWLCVDETIDIKQNTVINIVVRILDSLKSTLPLLLACRRLDWECTDDKITQIVLETLENFEVSASQVLLLVTDGAEKMRLVGLSLQEQGCRFLHVTCKGHTLHLIAETVRKKFPGVDALITSTKKVFIKSPKRLRALRDKCPGVPEPPQPILARWGAWLKAALYYAEYFQQLKAVILQFKPDEAAAITESQVQFQDVSVENDLHTIRNNYKALHDAMEKLQNSAMPLAESLQVVNDIGSTIHAIRYAKHDHILDQWESALKHDTGFAKLREIFYDVSTHPLSEYRECFNYACVTSIDVERSFSNYMHIFSPKRTCLLGETVETYLMLQTFSQWCPMPMMGNDTDNQATSSHTS